MMTVSLCVIAYNEGTFLPNLLEDLLKQTYPHELTEIVLVDGCSTDKTKSIMEDFKNNNQTFRNVQVLENPKRVQAAGWNVAIGAATSDVIIRIDAHTHLPEDFTEKNMNLQEQGEYVTGGVRPCLIEQPTAWKKTLLEVENSMFGSSISKSRRGKQKQYVKSMFHAAYRKEVFEKSGLFNENLIRTEDNEMHYRIREAGYKLCFDPDIVSFQYARSNLKKMLKQKYGNGYWVGVTLGVCPKCISIYHLVPFLFVGAIVATTVLATFGFWQFATIMWSAYFLFACSQMIVSTINKKANGFTLLMPFLFLLLHASYGIGTFIGLIKMPFLRKKYKNRKKQI